MSKPGFKEKSALIILGLVISLVLLELGLRLGGWAFLSFQEYKNKAAVSKEKGAYRILCLGESTTARSIEFDEGESAYPSQLQEVLNQGHFGKNFVVINAGVPGITTAGILKQLPDNLSKYNPDMVITMMGINDRGNILPYESASLSRIVSFLEESRVYKLISLLWLRCVNKLNELQEEDSFSIGGPPSGKFKKEEARLKHVIETNPNDHKAYLALGSYYLGIARFREAEGMFKKAILADAGDDAAYFELGKCYADMARFKEAEELFQKAIAINPQNYEACLELGMYYLQEGRLPDIEEMLKKVITRAPGNGKAYALLGQFYMYVRRDKEAEDILKRAVELDPENFNAILALGALYTNTARFREAEEAYARLDVIKPETYKTYVDWGSVYLQAGRSHKGEELMLKAIAINPESSKAYSGLGRFYFNQGKYPKAENALRKAIAINPESSEAYLGLGRLYVKQGKYPEACKLLKEALKMTSGSSSTYTAFDSYEASPRSFNVYATFGGYYYKATRLREAEKIFHKILEINPRNYEICLQLAKCYRAAGRLAETEALFKKAIAINPTESRAYFRLGCLYQIEARYHEAEQTWIKGLEKNPGNYYISSKLLQLYTQEKRSQEAEKIFQRTFSTDAKNYEIYLELGDHSRVDAHSPDTDDKLKGKLPSEIKGYIKLTDRMAIYQKATIDNYRNLRTILLDRGVKLIVVQYPCRSIEPLKHIFENKEGIIFVDNENSFKDALKHGDYKEYFNDCFAGDFGHCTRKGNRLLADNIAKAIIQAER